MTETADTGVATSSDAENLQETEDRLTYAVLGVALDSQATRQNVYSSGHKIVDLIFLPGDNKHIAEGLLRMLQKKTTDAASQMSEAAAWINKVDINAIIGWKESR